MRAKITLTDDNGKKYSGIAVLNEIDSTDSQKPKQQTNKKFSGLKGGIDFLLEKGFLDSLKSSKEVHLELKRENYFHSIPSVDKRLRFLVNKKILTRIKEDHVWKYALRK